VNRTLSPEFEFLCYLVRPDPDHGRALKVAQQGLDWKSVAVLAAAHRVRPSLLNALNASIWADGPTELKQELESFHRRHMARNLHAAREILNVAKALDKRGIPFATFKGLGLAISLYGDLSHREFHDIDLIVHETDVRAAEDALESCGYRAAQGNREYRQAFLGYQRQYMFKDSNTVLAIDLHWDFTSKSVPFPLQTSEIWNALSSVPIADRSVPVFGREQLAIFLAGHGAKEGWRSLVWVCDFAAFHQKQPDLNWNGLWERLNQKNRGRPILLGLCLAAELLGITVDTKLLRQARRDPKVLKLAELAIARMIHPTNAEVPNRGIESLGLDLCETWFEKLNVLWALAFTRTTGDCESLPLPRPLWRIYHLTRPFRLAGKLLSLGKYEAAQSTSARLDSTS
jgi:hypothetical protein